MRFSAIRWLVVLLMGFWASSCSPPPSEIDPAADLVDRFVAETGISGVAVTVGRNGVIDWSYGAGFADLEQAVPIDPAKTRFRVGSTAKSMTAAALGQLYESGRLDLDAPVQTYVADFPEKSGTITARQLAGHLSGVRHYANAEEFLSAVPYDSITDALSIFADDPLLFEPGTEFGYSTYGYNLLSAVLEKAAGEDFLDYMEREVFVRAGMANTVADRVFPLIPQRSRYYVLEEGEIRNAPWVDNSNKWAGGGFLSTSEDLVRFALAHLSERLMRRETVRLLWESQKTADGVATDYGLGWALEEDEAGRRIIRHSGGSVGGITEMRIYPDDDLVIAAVSNTSPANVKGLVVDLAEHFFAGQKRDAPRR